MKVSSTNLALVTVDALRYDSAINANTPNLTDLIKKHHSEGPDNWVKVGAHGTYTLPAHISMFQAGILPSMNLPHLKAPYNRNYVKLFRAQLNWTRNNKALYPTPEAPNIVKGFSQLGYRTVGVGGVHWFNNKYETSKEIWNQYFDEFYWDESFAEENKNCFENQLAFLSKLNLTSKKLPLFFFLNVAATHFPYLGFEKSVSGQMKAFEYVDSHFPALLSLLPRPLHLLIMADHGECFGEDGLWEHSCYHPMVMEVPMISVELT